MKINSKLPKFQMGGAAPAPTSAPVEATPVEQGAPGGAPGAQSAGGDPLMEIAQVAMQAIESQDCQAAMAVCEAFIQLIQQAGGGGEAPGQPSEPTFQKKGGKLMRKG